MNKKYRFQTYHFCYTFHTALNKKNLLKIPVLLLLKAFKYEHFLRNDTFLRF